MAVGSGLGSSFSMSAESTPGTRVAPTRSIRAKSASVNRTQERVQGQGIQAGSFGPMLDHMAEVVTGGEGTFGFDVATTKLGLILQTLMGSSSIAQQAATAAWLQTHTLGDPYGKALTVQVGLPQRDGTVKAFEGTGGKVVSAEFSCETKGNLTANVKTDFMKFDDTQTLAAPVYTSSQLFVGSELSVKMGTYGAESAVTGFRSVSCSIERPMDVDAYTAGVNKVEPVLNDFSKISGNLTADWTSGVKTALHDRMVGLTSTSLVLEWKKPIAIATTYFPTFRITIPGVTFTNDVQGADGVGQLSTSYAYSWAYDGTNAPKIEYMSTDIAI